MGYNIYITRKEHWGDFGGIMITEDDWSALVDADPELRWNEENGLYNALWGQGYHETPFWYDWDYGIIETKNPTRKGLQKMYTMADALNAKVQGEAGEYYDERGIQEDISDEEYFAPTPKLPPEPPPAWMKFLRRVFLGKKR